MEDNEIEIIDPVIYNYFIGLSIYRYFLINNIMPEIKGDIDVFMLFLGYIVTSSN